MSYEHYTPITTFQDSNPSIVTVDKTYKKKDVETRINPLREVTIPVTGLKIRASMLPNITVLEELGNDGRIQRIATLRSAAKITRKGGQKGGRKSRRKGARKNRQKYRYKK